MIVFQTMLDNCALKLEYCIVIVITDKVLQK